MDYIVASYSGEERGRGGVFFWGGGVEITPSCFMPHKHFGNLNASANRAQPKKKDLRGKSD